MNKKARTRGRRRSPKDSRRYTPSPSEIQERKMEEEGRRIEGEKAALRRIEITGGDEVALGCKSSGWPEYKEVLRQRLLLLRKVKLGRADQAAAAFNRTGFKTGSGQLWTPRLINIAKITLFGELTDRLVRPPPAPQPQRSRSIPSPKRRPPVG